MSSSKVGYVPVTVEEGLVDIVTYSDKCYRLVSYSNAFWFLLLSNTLTLLLLISVMIHDQGYHVPSESLFPSLPEHRVIFEKGENYEHQLAMTPGSPWMNLLPGGNYGFVQVRNPRKYNLTGGMPLNTTTNARMPEKYQVSGENEEDVEVYVISMFHQLHCLMMFRDTFMNVDKVTGRVVAGIKPIEDISNGHLNHCFDYLRQAIMCAGDNALDRYAYDESNGSLEYGVNGWGTMHMCRSFDQLYEFANEHGWYRGMSPEMLF